MNNTPPSWLVFVLGTVVAALLGNGLYYSYRRGAISYIRWYGREGPYRRATEPFRYWFSMAATGFAFVVCTLAAALMLFLTIVNW